MSFQKLKPLLINYLIDMTGLPITPNQVAKYIGVTNKTASRYLSTLVHSGEVDCVQRILLPSKKLLAYGYMYYVNNLSLIKNQSALHQTQTYQKFKKMYPLNEIYHAVTIKYVHPNGTTKKHTLNIGLIKSQ